MNANENDIQDPIEVNSRDVMDCLINLFKKNDMLNQFFTIEHRYREYKIYCGEDRFFAYRINPNPGISPGLPGWITCMVTQDEIIDCKGMNEPDTGDPSVYEWLDCITYGNFKHI